MIGEALHSGASPPRLDVGERERRAAIALPGGGDEGVNLLAVRGDAGQRQCEQLAALLLRRPLECLDQRGPTDDRWVEGAEAVCAEDDQQPSAQATRVVDLLDDRVDANSVFVMCALRRAIEGDRVARR